MKYKILLLKNSVLLSALLSSSTYAGIESVLYNAEMRGCNVIVSHEAVKGEKGTIVIRTQSGKKLCQISKKLMATILNDGFKAFKAKKSLSEVSSIFLGGKLSTYRWMSDLLIKKSKNNIDWDKKTGKPKKGDSNSYVNNILFSSSVLTSVNEVLKKYRYKITGVRCEKILIKKLPFDAMCWINIKKQVSLN